MLTLADFHLGSDANVLLPHTLLTPPLNPFGLMPTSNNSNSTNIGMTGGQQTYLQSQSQSQQMFNFPTPPPPPLPLQPRLNNNSSSAININSSSSSAIIGGTSALANIHQQLLIQKSLSSTSSPFGATYDKLHSNKSCAVIGTVDGGLGILLPVDERTYRILSLLQQLMTMSVPTVCALNPRDYRLIKTPG